MTQYYFLPQTTLFLFLGHLMPGRLLMRTLPHVLYKLWFLLIRDSSGGVSRKNFEEKYPQKWIFSSLFTVSNYSWLSKPTYFNKFYKVERVTTFLIISSQSDNRLGTQVIVGKYWLKRNLDNIDLHILLNYTKSQDKLDFKSHVIKPNFWRFDHLWRFAITSFHQIIAVSRNPTIFALELAWKIFRSCRLLCSRI